MWGFSVYESNLCNNEHYLSSSENKAWKKFRPVWDLNPWPLWYQGAGHYVDLLYKSVKWWINDCEYVKMYMYM